MSIIEHKFTDRNELIENLTRVFMNDLQQALDQQMSATLFLSGGSTPAPLYQRLSTANLNWSQVNVALVDERWADPDSTASNERLLHENMLINNAADANFTGMKNDHQTPFAGEAECNAQYAKLPSPYAICLLGMGPDGHTASLFPGDPLIDETEQWVGVTEGLQASPPVPRVSLTLPILNAARKIVFTVSGEAKSRIALEIEEQAEGFRRYPAARINAAGSTLWFIATDS